MQLQITTDYAIRIINYLAKHSGDLMNAKEMSYELGITYPYFIKVATRIKQAGYIKSVQGPTGGYALVKDAADITLYDIISVMKGPIRINRCLENDRYCSRKNDNNQDCMVQNILESLQRDIIAILKNKRFCDLGED